MSSTPGTETAGVTVSVSAPPRQGPSRLPYSFERHQGGPHGQPTITHERISFTAACPACGEDTEWVEVREDTRVRCAVHCSCT